ncbi:M48 family metallopeptidase [Thalassobium sp. R2A62]|uniref:M48 family metallopeptidase n=1 Tax=Thalassobium sp. R2A62 TaxID=633131 RepID=UPI0001B1D6A5|nr:M48 family metallopeptidase [Thalassobium sp. R2A62]EET49626.1 peptidase M48 Ste24p [Thalassobium sp. R2A62]
MTERTVIRVGAEASVFSGTGQFFDGDMAHPQDVTLAVDDTKRQLILTVDDDEITRWPYDEMRSVRDQASNDLMVLRLRNDGTPRLILTDAADMAIIRSRAKHLHKRPPVENKKRLVTWSLAAVASVALIIGVLVPVMADQLAEFLPPEGEKALGDTTFAQIRGALDETGFQPLAICEDPDGLAALDKMRVALEAEADLPVELTVHVLDHPMVNAFALPGGYVVFFRGLIDAAETHEEVAAVFAHEMGHVEARDPTRIAMRSAGSIGVLGLLFGDFAGGALVLFLAERLIQADYTQAAEAKADTYAHAVLADAGVPPSAIGDFFERMVVDGADADDSIIQHFISHPEMGDRIAAARAATPNAFAAKPLLTVEEWRALQGICPLTFGS